nr:hypothetical protein QOL21_04645 [Acholeplasma laidlawii]
MKERKLYSVSIKRYILNIQDWHESDTSKMIIEFIFPSEFKISSETLYRNIMHMIIRLETLPEHGDTEVIAISTITNISISSHDFPKDTFHFVYE